jgi:putative ABC transport system permease protein
MSALLQDVRYAGRTLMSAPRASALIVAIIAVAIGASVTMFSIVDQTLLRLPPFAHADRLVDVHHLNSKGGGGGNQLAPAKIAGWQAQPAVFERLEAYAPRQFDVTGTAEPERIRGFVISTGLLPMLGVSPALGRGFVVGEGQAGAARVALISHGLWRRRFGGSGDVLGREILLNDQPHTIVGVMPRRFRLHGEEDDVWLPIDIGASAGDMAMAPFAGIGRLRPGLDAVRAQAEADRVADHLQATAPIPRSWYVKVEKKLVAGIDSTTTTALFVLLGAVTFVLLTACANVANLLLITAARRGREMAVRSALGATRLRLMRQVLLEGCLLAAAGGLAGILSATWALDAVLTIAPTGLTVRNTTPVEIDQRVVLVGAAVALTTGVLFALIPAVRGSRPNLMPALHGVAAATDRDGSSFGRVPSLLVVAEVAFSLILLVGAALMTRTLLNLEALDTGVDPRNVVSMRVDLPMDRYPTVESRTAFFDDLSARLRDVSGVTEVAGTWGMPTGGVTFGVVMAEGSSRPPEDLIMPSNTVTPGFFQLLRIPIVAGRDFRAADAEDAVIVSRALAERFWPPGEAVGRRLRVDETGPWQTVVGVVENIDARRDESSSMHLYYRFRTRSKVPPGKPPSGRRSYDGRVVLVRTENHPMVMVPAIKSQVWALDRNQTVEEVRSLEDLYRAAFDRQRFVLWVMSGFASVALMMTVAGLFGVLSRAVVQRRREIGIRVALGASSDAVFKLIVGRGVGLTAVGLVVGVAGALALSRFLTALLFGVAPYDPLSFAAVAMLFTLIAAIACWAPARAAMRVQPAAVLRAE